MANDYRIRRLDAGDLPQAMDLVWQVFSEFEAPEYPPEGQEEFRRFIAPPRIGEQLAQAQLLIWGCWDGEAIVGVIAARPPCHIALLFVRRDHHRRGIARTLWETVRDYYLDHSGERLMTVNSSPYAVAVYSKLGFCATDTEQLVNGLRFIPMEKRIR